MRSLGQPCSVNNTFLASGKAKNGVFSLRIAHIALFYTINVFFLIAPRDLRYYRASAQPCAALLSQQHLFLASGKAKNGVFSLRIAHIALFYTMNVFF